LEKQLIIRYLQKKCTPVEAERVIQWLNSDDFEPELMRQIERDLHSGNYHNQEDQEHLEPILQGILLRDEMENIKNNNRSLQRSIKNSNDPYYHIKVAFTILIFLSTGFYFLFKIQSKPETTVTEQLHWVSKENSKGRKSNIFLPDGSEVNLNADSKIEYPEKFTDSSRTVFLTGEAFFNVTHDSLRPFKVITDHLSVQVLGTSFNVDSYRDCNQVSVALESGKVIVKKPDQKMIFLEPGSIVQYDKESDRFSKATSFDPKLIYGWKNGLLIFKSADFNEVIAELEKWYGIDLIINNQPAQPWSYTGEFHDQSLKSVLESLSFTQNFKYSIENKNIVLKF